MTRIAFYVLIIIMTIGCVDGPKRNPEPEFCNCDKIFPEIPTERKMVEYVIDNIKKAKAEGNIGYNQNDSFYGDLGATTGTDELKKEIRKISSFSPMDDKTRIGFLTECMGICQNTNLPKDSISEKIYLLTVRYSKVLLFGEEEKIEDEPSPTPPSNNCIPKISAPVLEKKVISFELNCNSFQHATLKTTITIYTPMEKELIQYPSFNPTPAVSNIKRNYSIDLSNLRSDYEYKIVKVQITLAVEGGHEIDLGTILVENNECSLLA